MPSLFFCNLCTISAAKKVFPMRNGELDQSGLLSPFIRGVGTFSNFCSMARRQGVNVIDIEPGINVDV